MSDPATAPRSIGFIGCGTLTEAVVRAFRARGSQGPEILLSPRSEAISRRLAADLPGVRRLDSNAAVAREAEIVFLAVRPQVIDEALAGVSFRPGQIVASFLAKTSLADLSARLGPEPTICRVTPLTAIAHQKGPIILHPTIPAVAALFEGLGECVEAASEGEIMALGCASGLLSTYFGFQAAVIAWLTGRGVPRETAERYVLSMLEGLSATAIATPPADRDALIARHETPAGLNERSRTRLEALGWFDEIGRALDALDQRAVLLPTGGTPPTREGP